MADNTRYKTPFQKMAEAYRAETETPVFPTTTQAPNVIQPSSDVDSVSNQELSRKRMGALRQQQIEQERNGSDPYRDMKARAAAAQQKTLDDESLQQLGQGDDAEQAKYLKLRQMMGK